MSNLSAWEMLRAGNVEEGTVLLLDRHKEGPSPSNTMSLGVAYLWARRYEAAWEHFQVAIKTQRWTHDRYYGMAGTAKWCLGEPELAVECWKSGLRCNYGDAGGASVGNQLLLFAASILDHTLIPQAEVLTLLQAKLKDPRIRSWPGPLAEFCTGRTEVDFRLDNKKYYVHSHRVMIEFYRGLLALRDGDQSRNDVRKQMRELSDTSRPEWVEQRAFTNLLGNEEFFIARHEASLR